MNLNDHSSPGIVGFLKYSYFTFCFPGIAKISVTVDLDANGIIHLKVACEEKEETLVIGNSNGRLDREEIERIIKDAELCNDYISKENVPAEIPLPVRNYIRTACPVLEFGNLDSVKIVLIWNAQYKTCMQHVTKSSDIFTYGHIAARFSEQITILIDK